MGEGNPGVRASGVGGVPLRVPALKHVTKRKGLGQYTRRGAARDGARDGSVSLTASLVAGGAGFVAVAALTGLVRASLRRHGVMDRPNERSSHVGAVPRGGGIAVVGVLLATWLALWLWETCQECGSLFWIALAGALGLAAVSWLDDVRGGFSVVARLIAQIAAVGAGIASLPGDGLVFQGTIPALADHALAAAAWLWFVNLFNFMDGIDGISGVEGASLGLGAFLLALLGAVPAQLGPLALALAGVSLAFLLWNWNPARIFLGDVGSVPLGYLAGWLLLALAAAGAWQAALLLPAYYLADATLTLSRRLLRGRRIWQAHREHFYQRVVAAGWSHGRTAALIAGHNLLLVGLAVASQRSTAAAGAALATGALLVAALLWYLHAAARASCGAAGRA